jgi:4-hydroxy-tetrahydrodipicolinate reductase
MPELRVVVAGAGGRMGRTLARTVLAEPKLRLVGALDRPDTDVQGKDVGQLAGVAPCGVTVSSDPLPAFAHTDVVLDFTAPAATLFYAELSAQARIVHVIGTTGLTKEHDEKF